MRHQVARRYVAVKPKDDTILVEIEAEEVCLFVAWQPVLLR